MRGGSGRFFLSGNKIMVATFFQISLWIFSAYFVYVVGFMVWAETQARGDRYFARPLAKRQRFVRFLKQHAAFIRPLFDVLAKVFRLKKIPQMRYQGVTGPLMVCSKKSYAFTNNYQPGAEDIFVATQMKCGTTWMQQIVFEVLHAGDGDLSDTGYRHMYALSPWIETSPVASVAMAKAPLVGKQRKRIIKTHMPAQFIRHSSQARYLYVKRTGSPVNWVELAVPNTSALAIF